MLEDRLRDAFTALATTVSTPPPGLRRPSRFPAVAAAAAAVLVMAGGAWFAFQPSNSAPAPPAASSVPTATSASVPPKVIPYELYTHCGIDEAKIGDIFYEAKTPIPGPPNDWGNPYQTGTMSLVSDSEVVFRDNLGHVVQFHVRPGATGFKRTCD